MSNKTKKFGDPRNRTVNNQRTMDLSEIYQIYKSLSSCSRSYVYILRRLKEFGKEPDFINISETDDRIKKLVPYFYKNHKETSLFLICKDDIGQTSIVMIFDDEWYNPEIRVTPHFIKNNPILEIPNKWYCKMKETDVVYFDDLIQKISENYKSFEIGQF